MAQTVIAALLALGSAPCIAIGDVLQQRAAHCITDRSVVNVELFTHLVSGGEWMWGSLLTAAVIVVVIVGNPQAGRSGASLQT